MCKSKNKTFGWIGSPRELLEAILGPSSVMSRCMFVLVNLKFHEFDFLIEQKSCLELHINAQMSFFFLNFNVHAIITYIC